MKVLVIANPGAGTGQTLDRVCAFARELERRGHHVETCVPQGMGEVRKRVCNLPGDVDRLVIAGGDGTVNQVLNGVCDPSRLPILHMATGTANMLARDLGLPRRPKALAEVLEYGAVRNVDMGLVGKRRFLLLASVGFDATVAQEVQKRRGATLGYHGYALPILRGLSRWCPTELAIQVDGKEKLFGTSAMVLKARHYGGHFVFADAAQLDSGYFEVFIFHGGSVSALFRYGLAAFLGRASKLRDVTRVTGTTVTVESLMPTAVEVDGDYFGTTPIKVELRPSFVPLVVPRDLIRLAC
jgi:diacylglycerol kinase (ATP)